MRNLPTSSAGKITAGFLFASVLSGCVTKGPFLSMGPDAGKVYDATYEIKTPHGKVLGYCTEDRGTVKTLCWDSNGIFIGAFAASGEATSIVLANILGGAIAPVANAATGGYYNIISAQAQRTLAKNSGIPQPAPVTTFNIDNGNQIDTNASATANPTVNANLKATGGNVVGSGNSQNLNYLQQHQGQQQDQQQTGPKVYNNNSPQFTNSPYFTNNNNPTISPDFYNTNKQSQVGPKTNIEAPYYQAPTYQAPTYKAPTYNAPTYNPPSYSPPPPSNHGGGYQKPGNNDGWTGGSLEPSRDGLKTGGTFAAVRYVTAKLAA